MSVPESSEMKPGCGPERKQRRFSSRLIQRGGLCLGVLFAFFLQSMLCWTCILKKPPSADQIIRWPDAGKERIRFLKTVSSPKEMGVGIGLMKQAVSVFSGRKATRIMHPVGGSSYKSDVVVVLDSYQKGIHRFDLREGRYKFIEGIGNVRLQSPVDAAFSKDGRLFVTDSKAGRIFRFKADGKGDAVLKSDPPLQRPTGICYHAADNMILVSETVAHRVAKLSLDGKRLGFIGRRGTGEGCFNFPVHLAVDRQGMLYVCDAMNFRIQKFKEGKYAGEFGTLGDGYGSFSKPKGIAVDSKGHIYVADSFLEAVQIFSPEGDLLLVIGRPGHEAGEFWLILGLWIDERDRLYVADSYNQRLQIFRYVGG